MPECTLSLNFASSQSLLFCEAKLRGEHWPAGGLEEGPRKLADVRPAQADARLAFAR